MARRLGLDRRAISVVPPADQHQRRTMRMTVHAVGPSNIRRSTAQRSRRMLASAALCIGALGCTTTSHGGPYAEQKICGQVVFASLGGFVPNVVDLTTYGDGRAVTGYADLLRIRVASGCSVGAMVMVDPPGALLVRVVALAKDGNATVVALAPGTAKGATLTAVAGGRSRTVRVDLA